MKKTKLPIEPKKEITVDLTLYAGEYSIKLDDLLKKLNLLDIDYSTVTIQSVEDYESSYIDVTYKRTVPNPNYDKELTKYKKRLEKFQ